MGNIEDRCGEGDDHPHPSSLFDGGKLQQGKKPDLLNILMQETDEIKMEPPRCFYMKTFGASVVHILPITNINPSDEYASAVFIPHLMQQLETSARIDCSLRHL